MSDFKLRICLIHLMQTTDLSDSSDIETTDLAGLSDIETTDLADSSDFELRICLIYLILNYGFV